MGHPPRLQFEGALYHVYPRGNRRLPIAHADQDYRLLERYLIEAAIKTGVLPRAWHPMPNHYHVMVETPRGNLAVFMQMWLSRYARYYNQAYQKIGHVFHGRYGSRLVQKDLYQRELIRYVHLQRYRAKNPETVDSACDFYSSHRFYMGEAGSPQIQSWIKPMLLLFGSTLDSARKNYARFLADGLKNGEWENFYQPKTGLIGAADFSEVIETRHPAISHRKCLPAWRQDTVLEELLKAAVRAWPVRHDQLSSPNQRRDLSRIRQAIVYVGRRMGLTVNTLARALKRGESTVAAMDGCAERQSEREIAVLRKLIFG